MNRKERLNTIRVYAEHWKEPISDFKNLNKFLKLDYGIQTQKRTVAKILNYI